MDPISFSVPSVRAAGRIARREFMRSEDWLPVGTSERVLLLLSALVNNAVLHSGMAVSDEIDVRARIGDGLLWVEVTDHGAGFDPVTALAGARDRLLGGYGLLLIERIAERWDVVHDDTGTHVWFELSVAADAIGKPGGGNAHGGRGAH